MSGEPWPGPTTGHTVTVIVLTVTGQEVPFLFLQVEVKVETCFHEHEG